MLTRVDTRARRATQATTPNPEAIVRREQAFKADIQEFQFVKVDHPFHIILKELKIDHIDEKNFDNESIRLLAAVEIINMLNDHENPEIYIKNIVQILSGENLKVYQAQLMQKGKQVKFLTDELKFQIPKTTMVLQKLGQVLKSIVLRECFVTQEAFGQHRGKKRTVLSKPNLFKNQTVQLESKKQVNDKHKHGDKSSSKHDPKFPWPDRKELNPYTFRLFFKELSKKRRERAIYIRDLNDCIAMKNNAILRRLTDKDSMLKTKMHTLKTIWKVRQAEFFYTRFIQPFFADPLVNQSIVRFGDQIRQKIRAFFKVIMPNSYESNYNPANMLDFKNNSYMVIKRPNAGIERIELNTQKAMMATLVSPELYAFPATIDLIEEKKRGYLKSPFEKLDIITSDSLELLESLSSAFKPNPRQKAGQMPNLRLVLEEIFTNTKIIVRLKRVLFQDFELRKASFEEYSSIPSTNLESEVFITNSSNTSKSSSYLSSLGNDLISFDFKSSIKVDTKSLQQVSLRIHDLTKHKVVVDTSFNLLDHLDGCSVENLVCVETKAIFKGVEVSAVACFCVYLIPRNLECAHILVSREVIDLNFDRFFEIVNTVEDYNTFKQLFYPPEYVEQKLALKSNDLFFYMRQAIEPTIIPSVIAQENLYLNSFRQTNIDGLITNLFRIKKPVSSFNELLLDIVVKINGNYEIDASPFYELIMRVNNFLSGAERVFIERYLYLTKTKVFFNLEYPPTGYSIHRQLIITIEDRLSEYLKELPYITDNERMLIKSVVFEVMMRFENNQIDGKSYKIDFSPLFIPVIIKTVIANQADVQASDLVMLSANRILKTMEIKHFTEMNHLSYLDSLVVILKMLFKNMYPDQYAFYVNYAINFDTILLQAFMNSYAEYLEPLQYNQYQDFKSAVEIILTLQNSKFHFLDMISDAQITLSSLIDVLFALNALVSNFVLFKSQLSPESFIARIKNSLKKENYDLRRTMIKILELLDYLYDAEFYVTQFKEYRKVIRERHDVQISSFKNFSLVMKLIGLNEKQIKQMITNELTTNDELLTRVRTLFYESEAEKHDKHDQKIESQTEITGQNGSIYPERSLIFQDIFFDILPDLTAADYTDIQADRKPLEGFIATLVELNGLDSKLIDNFLYAKSMSTDLHNIYDLDNEGLSSFVRKYFKMSEAQKLELYNDLSLIYQRNNIPILGLIVMIICASGESPYEIVSNITHFADQLTGCFFSAKDKHFNEVVKLIIAEIYSAIPVTVLPLSIGNLIDSSWPALRSGIQSARIALEKDLIDITDLCVKHYNSHVYLTGKPSILFGADFCNDLIPIFHELQMARVVDSKLTKFELLLEAFAHGSIDTHSIFFRISFDPEIKILSNKTDALDLTTHISEQNLIPKTVIQQAFYNSPFCFFSSYSTPRTVMGAIDKPFKMRFQAGKRVYEVELRFGLTIQDRAHFNLQPWMYKEVGSKPDPYYDSIEFKLTLPFSFYAFRVKEIVNHVCNNIVEHLAGEDLFRFIKKNTMKTEYLTARGKAIDPYSHLYDLSEFDKFAKGEENFGIVVNYKFN